VLITRVINCANEIMPVLAMAIDMPIEPTRKAVDSMGFCSLRRRGLDRDLGECFDIADRKHKIFFPHYKRWSAVLQLHLWGSLLLVMIVFCRSSSNQNLLKYC
jgi:hypothetical protein